MDLTTRNTRIEETCKLVFFVYSILASPKHVSCFFFFFNILYAGNIQPVAARRMSTLLRFLWSPHYVFTSLPLSADCGQDKTLEHAENVYVLSDVWAVVSFLFLFCFCQCSVDLAQTLAQSCRCCQWSPFAGRSYPSWRKASLYTLCGFSKQNA